MDKTLELTEIYKSTIEDALGLIVNIDDDGDLRFKHPDLGTFFISIDAINDPEFMMLQYPAFMDAKSGLSEDDLHTICNQTNRRCKGAKLFVTNNEDRDVYASLQMLVALPGEMPTKDYLAATLKRALSMVSNSVNNFTQEARMILVSNNKKIADLKLH